MKKEILFKFTLFKFLEGLTISFAFATGQIFFSEHGLDLLQINILNLVYMTSILLAEIPTGVLADYFGRKKLVIIGLLLNCLGFLIIYFADNYILFILAQLIAALGFSCISGALEALIVSLANDQKNYNNLFKRAEISQLGVAIGALLGAYLGQVNLALPWLMTSIFYFLLTVVFLILFRSYKEDSFYFKRESALKMAKEGIRIGLGNKGLIGISILSAILALSMQSLNMFWSLHLKKEYFFELKYMGYVFLVIVLFSYLGSQLSPIWQKKFKSLPKAIIFSLLITIYDILVNDEQIIFFGSMQSYMATTIVKNRGSDEHPKLNNTGAGLNLRFVANNLAMKIWHPSTNSYTYGIGEMDDFRSPPSNIIELPSPIIEMRGVGEDIFLFLEDGIYKKY